MDWTSGLGGVGGRGRASTHGAFSWVGSVVGSERDKKTDFEFFWGREGGVPGRGATEEGVGGGGGLRSRAQGAGVVGVRAERIGVKN